MNESPFKVGDVVRHKASHQYAVVTGVPTECANQTHKESEFGCRSARMEGGEPCNQQPTGVVYLKVGLTANGWAKCAIASVYELELAPAKDEPQ